MSQLRKIWRTEKSLVLVGGLNTRNAIERTHTVLTKEFSFQLEKKQLLSKREDSSSLYDED